MLFSSVTAEQEELVAKMLASGMDEATAYQYLQQLCGLGVAGKGSKLNFYPIFAKISTSPKTLYSYIPAYIHLSSNPQVSFALQILARHFQSLFVFWIFFISLSCFLQHSIILQLCATYVASVSNTPPCLKATCLQKPSAMWAVQSVSELLRNRLRMRRKS